VTAGTDTLAFTPALDVATISDPTLNSTYTVDFDEPAGGARTAWWTLQPPTTSGYLRIDTLLSRSLSYPGDQPVLTVTLYEGSGTYASLVEVASGTNLIKAPVEAGHEYYLQVGAALSSEDVNYIVRVSDYAVVETEWLDGGLTVPFEVGGLLPVDGISESEFLGESMPEHPTAISRAEISTTPEPGEGAFNGGWLAAWQGGITSSATSFHGTAHNWSYIYDESSVAVGTMFEWTQAWATLTYEVAPYHNPGQAVPDEIVAADPDVAVEWETVTTADRLFLTGWVEAFLTGPMPVTLAIYGPSMEDTTYTEQYDPGFINRTYLLENVIQLGEIDPPESIPGSWGRWLVPFGGGIDLPEGAAHSGDGSFALGVLTPEWLVGNGPEPNSTLFVIPKMQVIADYRPKYRVHRFEPIEAETTISGEVLDAGRGFLRQRIS
jgi:hypothetical protein